MACNPKATPSEQAQEIYLRFASHAFRRPVKPAEVKPYVALFEAAGFREIELFGSISGEPFTRSSPRLIVAGTRPA